ncbi:phage terminase small subunit P27 family [Clostridium botulinum]|uniref:Phage terminase small subunit P27 family n=1 Tax=Clostridium botulinum TaxID=1491 RepID=A0A846JAK2_CLOBO|nr:phage terminase small subunit P27 family [Clostridium botulinum]ACA54658.1 phage terminase, small subunit, P27 family [Clostridium botulinum A3 str. Loch Maree]NFH66861.1 phage terminase small subunit P27 family [Clostridium botulinum]NFJ10622.1 phage terminase small subunit P27 family [Clostridium botulinum]NFK15542.1 phage terminase small subunit P27 family [Clostridium botulinum]NFM95396.1 phage terminase small subunit P27 family [Clostridium botulinum]
MARASKPVDLQTSHLTKEEIESRKEQEERLKGNSDKIYKPPKHLSKEEKKIYKFLVNELKESSILCNLDITILKTTVDAICRMEECKENINKYGVVLTKEDGTLYRNPATTIYKDYNSIFNKCCMEIGLSPSARAKLSVLNVNAQQEKEDPLLKVLRGDGK